MSIKVTDLEKFVREEIWGPFWPAHPDCGPGRPETRFTSRMPENYTEGMKRMGRKRYTVDETFQQLVKHQDTDWHRMVIRRIAKIGFRFPKYIQHPLVSHIEHHTLIAANGGERA